MNIIVRLSLISFLLIFAETADVSDDQYGQESPIPDCNLDKLANGTLNQLTGKLKTSTDALKKKSLCRWDFVANATDATITFDIESFKLLPGDSFYVLNGKDVVNLTTVFKSSSIMLTGLPNKGVSLILNLTQEAKQSDRQFEIVYYLKDVEHTITDNNQLTIGYVIGTSKIKKTNINFRINDVSKNYKFVLSVYESTLNQTAKNFKFAETENPPNDFSSDYGDLFPSKDKITITVENLDLTKAKEEHLTLHYNIYDSSCTVYSKGDKEVVMNMPTSDKADSINCIALIEADNYNYNLIDYSKMIFINNLDVLTIRSGNRLTSPITITMNKYNKDELKNNFINLMQDKRVHISYKCQSTINDQVNPPVSSLGITSIKSGGGISKIEKDYKVAKVANDNFILIGDSSTRTMMTSSKQIFTDGVIEIFDNLELSNKKPLMTIANGQMVPENIWSTNNIIRVHLLNISQLDFGLKFTTNKLDSIANENDTAITLTGKQLDCNQQSNWLVPSLRNIKEDENKFVYIMNIPYIVFNSTDDCLIINMLKDKRSQLFKLCGNNETIINQSLPPLMFKSDYLYEIIYKRGKTNCVQSSAILLQFSLLRNSLANFGRQIHLQMGNRFYIQPETYPNGYILHDHELNDKCSINHIGCGYLINNDNHPELIGHVKFTDLDLAVDHELKLEFSEGDPRNLTIGSKLPDDYLIEKNEFIGLLSTFRSDYSIDEKITGRGFRLTIDTFDCGATVFTSKNTTKYISEDVIKGTKCIFIIDGKMKGLDHKILNFSINYLKSNQSEAKKGKLTIYDSATLRDNSIVHINESLQYNPASVNRTIIIYEKVDEKSKLLGLNISWKLDDCETKIYCDDGKRCVLPEWKCDGLNHCQDGLDQKNCNSSTCPKPNPEPKPEPKSGVNGWVIAFIIIPLSMVVGALIARFGPLVVRRFRGGQYTEFSSLSDVN